MACAECTSGSIHTGTPVGKEITLGGLQSYVTGDETSQRIIVFGTDIFGWRLPNARILADEYAAKNFWVVVPDLFGGRELPRWTLTATEHTDKPTLKQRLLRPLLLFLFIPFLFRNTKASQSDKINGLLTHLRATRPDAKIGMVGFCWGGRYAITMNSLFDATVAAHPSLVKFPGEVQEIKKPVSFAVAETDKQFDAKRADETEALLRNRSFNDFEVVVYKGVDHGWTVRTDMTNPEKKAKRDQARDQVLNWFEKYLTVSST
ncbi:dienelactone hydrolase [Rhodofomes roseus]|uniref:Dienelactone hydrolase n=1 Tax=Rhodofomes roseus TaxID=34475 RepID=A0ABQ8KPC6_9APHY|nr:dienelactone hydrolase [Rhodofomes roseus]KAH9840287.1 dienelactone hydrolase [Rhodofomes roseus]